MNIWMFGKMSMKHRYLKKKNKKNKKRKEKGEDINQKNKK